MSTVLKTEHVGNLVKAAALGFAAKACEKDFDRDSLPDGFDCEVELTLIAKVDSESYRHDFCGKLSVGHPSARAGSLDAGEWVAWMLCQVPPDARQRILNESLEVYDGTFPQVDKAVYDQVKGVMSAMRARKETVARGSVSVKLNKRLGVVG